MSNETKRPKVEVKKTYGNKKTPANRKTVTAKAEKAPHTGFTLVDFFRVILGLHRDSAVVLPTELQTLEAFAFTEVKGSKVLSKVGTEICLCAAVALGGDSGKVEVDQTIEQPYLKELAVKVDGLSYKIFAPRAIRAAKLRNSLESAMAASWFAYFSPAGKAYLFNQYIPDVVKNVEEYIRGSKTPLLVEGSSADSIRIKKWVKKAPTISSTYDYFHSKFLYYLDGFKVKFDELD